MLLMALLVILIGLSPTGGVWSPLPAGRTNRLLFTTVPLVLVAVACISRFVCSALGRFNVMLGVTIVTVVVPYPLFCALKAAPTAGMESFVVLGLSVLSGCLLDCALADLQMIAGKRAARDAWLRVVLVTALGVSVPSVLVWWSAHVWSQAPILYTTCLSVVTAIAIIADDAPA